jgi:predicted acylesterase/phospholipase RssA
MSSSVPIIFTPICYNDEYFIDGALSNHILLTQCDPKKTFGFNIIFNKHNQLKSLQDVLFGSLSILFNKGLKQFKNYKMMNIKNIDSNVMMINISNEYIHKLLNSGIKASKKFYKNELKDKINKLKKINTNKKLNDNI